MSRSLAKSGKAKAMKSLKEKWLSIVQSVREKGENGAGRSSTVTVASCQILGQKTTVSNWLKLVYSHTT